MSAEPVVPPDQKAKQNTDRELWREPPGDYYGDSIHVTQSGGIGMNVGGFVVVMPIREWHALGCFARGGNAAVARSALPAPPELDEIRARYNAVDVTRVPRDGAERTFVASWEDIPTLLEMLAGAALPAASAPPEPTPRCDHCVRPMRGGWFCDANHPLVWRYNERTAAEELRDRVVGSRPSLAGSPEQKISEPTNDELIALGECAVHGYIDFPAAKSWFAKWLAGRAETSRGTNG